MTTKGVNMTDLRPRQSSYGFVKRVQELNDEIAQREMMNEIVRVLGTTPDGLSRADFNQLFPTLDYYQMTQLIQAARRKALIRNVGTRHDPVWVLDI